ncbi:MAG: AIR synthase-related protein, partial [Halomonas sp.]
ATSAMDISDGLLADLGHIRRASHVGVHLDVDAVPLAEGLTAALGTDAARRAALSGGDDYELLVTIAPDDFARAQAVLSAQGLGLSAVGRCVAPDVPAPDDGGLDAAAGAYHGWQHFSPVATGSGERP